ncbi:Nucleolin [Arthrobotrys entomopaga]|nr:Nucleolin [Arthrobotrys entomopaga]
MSTSSKVYVGNLAWGVTDELLRQAFSSFGDIMDVIVMRDRDTGRSRGFGFITFGSQEQADAAISGMHEQELEGRRLKLNIANHRTGGGGGGGGYSGSGYSGGGGGYGGGGGGGGRYGGGGGYSGGGGGGYGGGNSGGYGGGNSGYGSGGYGGN